MSGSRAVEARDVVFRYGEREALAGVSFEVPRGRVHGFLGPNGSGKSTLFRILATLLPLQGGSASVDGCDLRGDRARARRRLGVVFQSPALDKKLTVRENLRHGGHLYGLSGGDLERRIDALLEHAALSDRARDRVAELSGGLRRRVELAKGLLHDPAVVLLDEPSTGLDPAARQDLWRLLRARDGLTVLFTTHLMDEAEHADRLTILDQGRCVAEGSPAELRAALGGEVLELSCAEPDALARDIGAAIDGGVADGGVSDAEVAAFADCVRVRGARVHDLVPELMRRFGERVARMTVSQPSLEDVFLERTGRRLQEADR